MTNALPLSLSCDSRKPPAEIRDDYLSMVHTVLNNTKENVRSLLQNSPCAQVRCKHCCTSANTSDVVSNLHTLACRMANLRLPVTDMLVSYVLSSIQCLTSCPERTQEANARSRKKPGTRRRRRRRNEQKEKQEAKRLCRADAALNFMTDCYERLNVMLMDHLKANSSTL